MRYVLEWLLPILRHTRLRRDVGFVRVLSVTFLSIIVPVVVVLGPHYVKYIGRWWYPIGARNPHEGVVGLWWKITRWYLKPYPGAMPWEPLPTMMSVCFGILLVVFFEFLCTETLVKKRPARRGSRCTWQTIKFVLLGSRAWMILIVLWIVATRKGWLQTYLDPWGQLHSLALIFVYAVPFILLMGVIAAQAANAVAALQDDRRCIECGYSLTGLTHPRCPECGTEFDLATLGALAMADPGDRN